MKTILIFIFCLALGFAAQAQGFRHNRGLFGAEAGYGKFTDKRGSFDVYSAGAVGYLRKNLYLKGQLTYAQPEQNRRVGLDATAAFSPLNIKETVFFNITGGATASYETPPAEIATKNKFNYGGLVGAELEIFPAHRVAIVGNFSQRIFVNRNFDMSSSNYSLTVGLRYNFW